MKVIEKDFVVGGHKVGTYMAYQDLEPELATPQPKDRVLPAPFFYEKRLFFFLIKRHEPGTPFWPNGGYEVRDESGGIRCYDLDQIILHPAVIKHKKTLDKMMRKAEKALAKSERDAKRAAKAIQKPKNTTGKRGRPAVDPAVKAAREAERVARAQRSGGKRGRPASGAAKPQTVKATSGKRGRPALSAAQVAAKTAARAATKARSGGRRGRPKATR